MISLNRTVACIAIAAAALLTTACGPIGPFAGGQLRGEERSWPLGWDRAAGVEQIQLETRPENPHSVNVWIVVVDSKAYVATSLLLGTDQPTEREWVRNVESNPEVRVRLEGNIYPARFEEVVDEALLARIAAAFRSKYPQLKEGRVSDARFYQIARRKI